MKNKLPVGQKLPNFALIAIYIKPFDFPCFLLKCIKFELFLEIFFFHVYMDSFFFSF